MAAAPKDLYKLLGIPRDASKKAIREAYYKRAKRLHPDRLQGKQVDGGDHHRKGVGGGDNNGNGNVQLFKEITHAYQILSDDQERSKYDMQMFGNRQHYGSNSARGANTGANGGATSYGTGADFADAQTAYAYWYNLHRRRMREEAKEWQQMQWREQDPAHRHSYFDAKDDYQKEYRYREYYRYHQGPDSFNAYYASRYGPRSSEEAAQWRRAFVRRNRGLMLRFWLIFLPVMLIYLFQSFYVFGDLYDDTERELTEYNKRYAERYNREDDPFAVQEILYRKSLQRRRERQAAQEAETNRDRQDPNEKEP